MDLIGLALAPLLDRPIKAALDSLWPRTDARWDAVNGLVTGQERQLIAPVGRAITHLQLGELQAARDLLIEAERLQPYAPVVKLALAMTFARTGAPSELAEPRVREALRMNPLLAPRDATGLLLAEGPRATQLIEETGPAKPRRGTSRTTSPEGPSALAPNGGDEAAPAWRVPIGAGRRITKAALACDPASGEGTVFVSWEYGTSIVTAIRHLGAIDLRAGTWRWRASRPLAKLTLTLASPSLLVLRAPKRDDAPFHLVDASTGVKLDTLSPAAFELLFWPAWSARSLDSRYQQTHVDLVPYSSDTMARISKDLQDDIGDSTVKVRCDEAGLSDPFAPSQAMLVLASNTFEVKRYTFGTERYLTPEFAVGRAWSSLVSRQKPAIKNFQYRAEIRRL